MRILVQQAACQGREAAIRGEFGTRAALVPFLDPRAGEEIDRTVGEVDRTGGEIDRTGEEIDRTGEEIDCTCMSFDRTGE